MLIRTLRTAALLSWRRGIATATAAIEQPLHYLNGGRHEGCGVPGTDVIDVLQPATGKVLCRMNAAGAADVDAAIEGATSAFRIWSRLTVFERKQILVNAACIIRLNLEAIVHTEVLDTGKPIWEVRADIAACADTLDYVSGIAPNITGIHVPLGGGSFGYTRREPLGVVGAIGAFNYPFQMAVWKSATALACGNTVVFKPSPLTPLTATLLAEAYSDAGLPPGAFNVLQGAVETGSLMCDHEGIAKISFTGSVSTGSKVMAACAKGIKKVTLELGGKSPLLIFDDCDLDNAVNGAMMANFLTQGQVCSNGTRVFVQRGVLAPFLDRFVRRASAMKVGDPFNEDTTVGAMISRDQADIVLRYVATAKQEGATVLCGGERVTLTSPELAGGHFLSPCVIADVTDDMRVAREEIFGAVASVLEFSDEEEVIDRANDSQFGLAGGVFTRDLARAHRVANALEAGNIYVNNYNVYPVDLPFGGNKKSGIGRENGAIAFDYFTQVKTVIVEAGDVDCPI